MHTAAADAAYTAQWLHGWGAGTRQRSPKSQQPSLSRQQRRPRSPARRPPPRRANDARRASSAPIMQAFPQCERSLPVFDISVPPSRPPPPPPASLSLCTLICLGLKLAVPQVVPVSVAAAAPVPPQLEPAPKVARPAPVPDADGNLVCRHFACGNKYKEVRPPLPSLPLVRSAHAMPPLHLSMCWQGARWVYIAASTRMPHRNGPAFVCRSSVRGWVRQRQDRAGQGRCDEGQGTKGGGGWHGVSCAAAEARPATWAHAHAVWFRLGSRIPNYELLPSIEPAFQCGCRCGL